MWAEFNSIKFLLENGAGGIALLIIIGVGVFRFFQVKKNGGKANGAVKPGQGEMCLAHHTAIAVMKETSEHLKEGQEQ